jgi:hypothetical protein
MDHGGGRWRVAVELPAWFGLIDKDIFCELRFSRTNRHEFLFYRETNLCAPQLTLHACLQLLRMMMLDGRLIGPTTKNVEVSVHPFSISDYFVLLIN